MEKTLRHSIVKQGLIILYYFSNRWYRKCLFTEDIPTRHTPKAEKTSGQHLDKKTTATEGVRKCNPENKENDPNGSLQEIKKRHR